MYHATIPIISAIGHETDTTIIDYVSDLRVSTPTAAAEKAVPMLIELEQTINHMSQRLNYSIENNYHNIHRQFSQIYSKLSQRLLVLLFNRIKKNLNWLSENLFKESK